MIIIRDSEQQPAQVECCMGILENRQKKSKRAKKEGQRIWLTKHSSNANAYLQMESSTGVKEVRNSMKGGRSPERKRSSKEIFPRAGQATCLSLSVLRDSLHSGHSSSLRALCQRSLENKGVNGKWIPYSLSPKTS